MNNAFATSLPERPTLIVVLGMHRSGTSVATRALETLGASFGDNLGAPVAGVNPKGFFEDMDVMRLDIELMSAAGVDWFALPAADFGRLGAAQLEEFRSRALALLRAKCSSGIFALKDPRICRLLPFWQPVFDQLDARVLYVLAFRHPISVARSLAARDSLPTVQSYLLWLAHVVAALRCTSGLPRALVSYDTIIEAPRSALERLSGELGLPLDPAKCEAFTYEFLEKGLRHTRFNSTDLERIDTVPIALKSLFCALETFAGEPSSDNGHSLEESLTRAEAFLTDAASLFAHDWSLEQDLRQTNQRIGKLEAELDAQTLRSAGLEESLVQALSRVVERERELHAARAQTEQERQAADTRLRELELERHAAQVCINTLEQEQQAARMRVGTLVQNCRAMEMAVTAQQRQFDQTAAALHSVLTSTSWRVTAPLRAVRRRFAQSP